jgi:hypothetical protein
MSTNLLSLIWYLTVSSTTNDLQHEKHFDDGSVGNLQRVTTEVSIIYQKVLLVGPGGTNSIPFGPINREDIPQFRTVVTNVVVVQKPKPPVLLSVPPAP